MNTGSPHSLNILLNSGSVRDHAIVSGYLSLLRSCPKRADRCASGRRVGATSSAGFFFRKKLQEASNSFGVDGVGVLSSSVLLCYPAHHLGPSPAIRSHQALSPDTNGIMLAPDLAMTRCALADDVTEMNGDFFLGGRPDDATLHYDDFTRITSITNTTSKSDYGSDLSESDLSDLTTSTAQNDVADFQTLFQTGTDTPRQQNQLIALDTPQVDIQYERDQYEQDMQRLERETVWACQQLHDLKQMRSHLRSTEGSMRQRLSDVDNRLYTAVGKLSRELDMDNTYTKATVPPDFMKATSATKATAMRGRHRYHSPEQRSILRVAYKKSRYPTQVVLPTLHRLDLSNKSQT